MTIKVWKGFGKRYPNLDCCNERGIYIDKKNNICQKYTYWNGKPVLVGKVMGYNSDYYGLKGSYKLKRLFKCCAAYNDGNGTEEVTDTTTEEQQLQNKEQGSEGDGSSNEELKTKEPKTPVTDVNKLPGAKSLTNASGLNLMNKGGKILEDTTKEKSMGQEPTIINNLGPSWGVYGSPDEKSPKDTADSNTSNLLSSVSLFLGSVSRRFSYLFRYNSREAKNRNFSNFVEVNDKNIRMNSIAFQDAVRSRFSNSNAGNSYLNRIFPLYLSGMGYSEGDSKFSLTDRENKLTYQMTYDGESVNLAKTLFPDVYKRNYNFTTLAKSLKTSFLGVDQDFNIDGGKLFKYGDEVRLDQQKLSIEEIEPTRNNISQFASNRNVTSNLATAYKASFVSTGHNLSSIAHIFVSTIIMLYSSKQLSNVDVTDSKSINVVFGNQLPIRHVSSNKKRDWFNDTSIISADHLKGKNVLTLLLTQGNRDEILKILSLIKVGYFSNGPLFNFKSTINGISYDYLFSNYQFPMSPIDVNILYSNENPDLITDAEINKYLAYYIDKSNPERMISLLTEVFKELNIGANLNSVAHNLFLAHQFGNLYKEKENLNLSIRPLHFNYIYGGWACKSNLYDTFGDNNSIRYTLNSVMKNLADSSFMVGNIEMGVIMLLNSMNNRFHPKYEKWNKFQINELKSAVKNAQSQLLFMSEIMKLINNDFVITYCETSWNKMFDIVIKKYFNEDLKFKSTSLNEANFQMSTTIVDNAMAYLFYGIKIGYNRDQESDYAEAADWFSKVYLESLEENAKSWIVNDQSLLFYPKYNGNQLFVYKQNDELISSLYDISSRGGDVLFRYSCSSIFIKPDQLQPSSGEVEINNDLEWDDFQISDKDNSSEQEKIIERSKQLVLEFQNEELKKKEDYLKQKIEQSKQQDVPIKPPTNDETKKEDEPKKKKPGEGDYDSTSPKGIFIDKEHVDWNYEYCDYSSDSNDDIFIDKASIDVWNFEIIDIEEKSLDRNSSNELAIKLKSINNADIQVSDRFNYGQIRVTPEEYKWLIQDGKVLLLPPVNNTKDSCVLGCILLILSSNGQKWSEQWIVDEMIYYVGNVTGLKGAEILNYLTRKNIFIKYLNYETGYTISNYNEDVKTTKWVYGICNYYGHLFLMQIDDKPFYYKNNLIYHGLTKNVKFLNFIVSMLRKYNQGSDTILESISEYELPSMVLLNVIIKYKYYHRLFAKYYHYITNWANGVYVELKRRKKR